MDNGDRLVFVLAFILAIVVGLVVLRLIGLI
jgi:hypothetical protein